MRLGHALRVGLLAGATLATQAFGWTGPAHAQIGSDRYAAIVLDNRSGTALVSANADETRHPASLTKMMTLYMVFEALREGRLSLDSRVTMSEEAASRPPSKLGIPAGQSISVEQAILALVTRSANDVASAVGERIGGSEARFAQMMTLRARSLGMSRTTFRNASGLPDPDQVTTARDMATLGRRLFQDFPDRYHYFGVTHAQFGGLRIRNHNRMLETYEGVDGIKTGFINASGFNIVTSASRGGQRVVGAVFGGSSWVERDQHMAALLDQSFERLGVASARPTPLLVRTAQAAALPRGGAQQAGR
ncbi:D-alanyl-D-alanine carboxypeptidase family protein, partial [Falsiroseomonas oryzae]|uniref:D-alanyl-D-alanine carboxypeptidase family protein n=1 Tax=Falsiroseomonas oryzae TaxID=2766473 RepID=UPI0022EB008B